MKLSMEAIVVVSEHQLSCPVGNETTILDTTHGMYFGLNEVATFIWSLIQQPKALHQIRDAIVREYEVTPQQCEADLFQVIEDLKREGLVTVTI